MDSAKEDLFETFWEELSSDWIGLSPKEIAKLAWLAGYSEASTVATERK